MRFNVNDEVRIRLTDTGRRTVLAKGLQDRFKADADGWCRVQLWTLMREFGSDLCNGCDEPFETEIEIMEPAT